MLRELLGAQRQATLARIAAMTREFEGIVAAVDGSNIDDEHDPEGPTLAFERAQVATLLDEALARIDDLDRALVRLDAGTYGLCERCGAVVAPERLMARPATRACLRCAVSPTPRLRRAPNRPLPSGDR